MQQAILRFFALHGRHDSRISVNIWGFLVQKTRKIAKISNFFPCPISMKSVGFMRVIGLQKLLTFGAIWLVN